LEGEAEEAGWAREWAGGEAEAGRSQEPAWGALALAGRVMTVRFRAQTMKTKKTRGTRGVTRKKTSTLLTMRMMKAGNVARMATMMTSGEH
jgi:hypothetical protein